MCLGLKRDGARGALPSAPGNTGAHAGSGRVSVVSVLLSGSVSLHRSWGPQTTARGSDNISGGSEDRSHSLGLGQVPVARVSRFAAQAGKFLWGSDN